MTPMTDQELMAAFDEVVPRQPAPQGVTTVAELQTLDEAALRRGYFAGFKNAADFTERDKGYWHGYFNGMVDGGFLQVTPEQSRLTYDYVHSGALRADVARWQAEAVAA